MSASLPLIVKNIGLVAYPHCFEQMQTFTEQRNADTLDELWLVQHPPVYTQGRAGKAEHILNAGDIPVVQVNRGGQVTYHGPGQIVMYFLLDIERRKLGVKDLVNRIERSMIHLLADYEIAAISKKDAPGVYVEQSGAKIGSIGLRVTQGRTYHGLSFNVDMDLSPFHGINPCGYAGMAVTQLSDLGIKQPLDTVQTALLSKILIELEYAPVSDEQTR